MWTYGARACGVWRVLCVLYEVRTEYAERHGQSGVKEYGDLEA